MTPDTAAILNFLNSQIYKKTRKQRNTSSSSSGKARRKQFELHRYTPFTLLHV